MQGRALRSLKRPASSLSAENKRARFHSLTCSTLTAPPISAAQNALAAPADTERLGDLLLDAFAILEVEVASIDAA
jgi:hypothetical protein